MTTQTLQPGADDVRVKMEDYALERVPLAERASGWKLMANTAGIASTLIQIAIAAGVAIIAGVWWGIFAGVVVALFGGTFGWLVGHVAYVSGTSSTVTARYYGLGVRGSALASIIFSFMIIGFLALENALLYYGTIFLFNWEPTLMNAVVIYGLLTIAWIILAMFGMRLVQITSSVLLIGFVILTVALAVVTVGRSPLSLGEIMGVAAASGPGHTVQNLVQVIAILAGSAGALALVDADHARYARSTKDVAILAYGGAIMIDIIVVVLGAVIVGGSYDIVTEYLSANPAVAATQPGADVSQKVSWLLANNTGAYFIILFGFVGFLLMYVAQIKAQVLNVYSGSLALSNLLEGLVGWNPGRVWTVIIANIVGLLFVAAGILEAIAGYLGILGASTFALGTVIIVDYFIIRRRRAVTPADAESVNWAGVISVILATVVGYGATLAGITPLGFVVSIVVAFISYLILRPLMRSKR